MTRQQEQIHRRANGTIDIDVYRNRALQLRSQCRTDALKALAPALRPILAVTVIVVPLALTALVHSIKAGPQQSASAMVDPATLAR